MTPDPAALRAVDDFVRCLRQWKVRAGDPSFAQLHRLSGVPSSTLADAVRATRSTLPRWDVVRGFVLACGGGAADVARWEASWRRLRDRQDAAPARWTSESGAAGPRQLPGTVPHLVGRREVLDRLDELRRDHAGRRPRSLVALVAGGAGVGKTAVTLHWAHRVAGHYPDGQIHLDLLASSGRPALTPQAALPLLLSALGVPPEQQPAGLDAQVGLYRSLSYPRRLLIVLDDARDAEQVRPLLPGGPGCATLVTSRNRLSALVVHFGVARLTLPPLAPDEAVDLVDVLLGGGRTDAEPAAVRELARRCGHLPLALRIAAANLVDHPRWSVGDYATRLAEDPLAALSLVGDDDGGVAAAFDRWYAELRGPVQQTFRRLASAPEPDFTADDAAALAGCGRGEVRRHLDALVAAHFVEPTGPGRYALADLLRRYADSLSAAERAARPAVRRLPRPRQPDGPMTGSSGTDSGPPAGCARDDEVPAAG